MDHSRRPMRILLGMLTLAVLLLPPATPSALGETCLSPFVKRLDHPEKYLYVFCLAVDSKNHDHLAVIDVNPDSRSYAQLIYRLDLGSGGNETHHFGYTDDRTHIWGCSLF